MAVEGEAVRGRCKLGIEEVKELIKEVERLTMKNAMGVADQVGISFVAARKDLRGGFAKINKHWSASIKGGLESR